MSHQPAALGHWTAPTLVLPGRNGTIAAISCTHAQASDRRGWTLWVVLASLKTAKPQRKQLASLLEPVAIDHILTYLDKLQCLFASNLGSKKSGNRRQLGLKSSPGVHYQNPTIPREMCHLHSGKKAPLRRFQTSLFVVFSVDFRRFSQLEAGGFQFPICTVGLSVYFMDKAPTKMDHTLW